MMAPQWENKPEERRFLRMTASLAAAESVHHIGEALLQKNPRCQPWGLLGHGRRDDPGRRRNAEICGAILQRSRTPARESILPVIPLGNGPARPAHSSRHWR